ncbi:MAG TPA: hypothetical protein VII33_11175 [Nakamurella sp.]
MEANADADAVAGKATRELNGLPLAARDGRPLPVPDIPTAAWGARSWPSQIPPQRAAGRDDV